MKIIKRARVSARAKCLKSGRGAVRSSYLSGVDITPKFAVRPLRKKRDNGAISRRKRFRFFEKNAFALAAIVLGIFAHHAVEIPAAIKKPLFRGFLSCWEGVRSNGDPFPKRLLKSVQRL